MRRVFGNWWFVTIAITVILIVLVAWALPLFVPFMRSGWIRIGGPILILAIWTLFAVLRIRKARKASAALAAALTPPSAADEESRMLAARMQEAMTALRGASGRKRDYLYHRPWYVIIGPPGAGKTTALLNSGLHFPYAEQALKGVGGTRNLDFWFADDAVLIDTAGRYTTQDSNQEVDARGWTSLLALLRKHRPLQPINGIIVAIPVDELIRADCAGIDAHAAAVRRRLAELRAATEVQAPIYVMLTKADMLAGFTEYFDDLDVEGRRAVLGRTFPFSPGRPNAEMLANAFDDVARALGERQAKRLFDEVDQGRRGLLLGFPAQLNSLRARFLRFLEGAFVAGEPGGVLRGFYFTSGVQQGAPLDRILASVGDVYNRQPQQAGGAGRAYFLNRLLNEVMFPEAGLVQMEPRARARQKTRLAAALGGIGLLSFLLLVAWGTSFAGNRAFQDEMLTAVDEARELRRGAGIDLAQYRASDADLRQVLPFLNALRDLPHGYAATRADGRPLPMRFGLFQAGLSDQAEQTYLNALRRVMLPRLLARAEAYMQAHRDDGMALFEPLKIYLMLGGNTEHFDARAVETWVVRDWATSVLAGDDSQRDREQLTGHLKALLDAGDFASVWPDRQAPLDGALIAFARRQITALDQAERAYAIMRQGALAEGTPLQIRTTLSAGDAVAFANPDEVRGIEIPYFFTREGYERLYRPRLDTIERDIRRDAWVFGDNQGTAGVSGGIENLRAGVALRYARDYMQAWDGMLSRLRPGDYFGNRQALGALTKTPSPLKLLLELVQRNTTFRGGVRTGGGAVDRELERRINRTRTGQLLNELNEERQAGAAEGPRDAGAEIATHFAPLHEFVANGLDNFLTAVREAGVAVMAARDNPGAGGADAIQFAMRQAMSNVASAAATGVPDQLGGFVSQISQRGSAAETSAASGAIGEAYAQVVLPACRAAAQNHYPFLGQVSAPDAGVAEVQAAFGPTGVLTSFVQQRLTPLLDTTGPVWRWKPDASVTSAFNPSTPEEFSKAARVRDLLVGGLSVRITVERYGTDTASVQLYSGIGQPLQFDSPARPTRQLAWRIENASTAYLVLRPRNAGAEEIRIEEPGPWALFRLIDQADRRNINARLIIATFGRDQNTVTFRIALESGQDPFRQWSFRCPTQL